MAVHEVHWPANSFPVADDWQHLSQHPRHAPLLTPPYTLHPNHQQPMTTVLPPIASFDTRNPYITPASMTAQHLEPYFHSNAVKQYTVSPPPRLPPIHTPPSFSALAGPSRPITPEPTPPPVEDSTAEVADWLFDTQKLASQTLAEKTCEMICYLWFSKAAATSDSSKQTSPHLTYMPHRSANTAHLQFSVSSIFVSFMHKLLQTTQLSQSVIVLSLHYVYRLKARNGTTVPSPGSEFRVAVAGLMMANKFVDDNTYTNKTWSEVSGIELSEINKMEREFLAGINFELYVDKQTYESWVNLLKGLVMSKERDSRYFRKSRQARAAPVLRPAQVPPLVRPRQRNYGLSPRARSSSPPRPYTGTVLLNESEPSSAVPMDVTGGSLYRLHGKRTAVDAFSPTSATFNVERPPKRPTGLSLDIPQSSAGRAPVTPSPLESIQFSKLSLGSSPAVSQTRNAQEHANVASRHISPQTLVAAYRLDPTKPRPAPQNLYFYSLAGSPLADDNRPRKGRLHFHQPPTNQVAPQYSYASQPTPVAVQSAHASPHERVYYLPPVLPHPYDGTWTQPRTYYDPRSYAYEPRAQDSAHLVAQPVAQDHVPVQAPSHVPQDSVRSAPFANAGPPGVHYYPYTVMPQAAYDDMWARGRRP